MNLLQLVLKQMRQRSLSTWLTLLSVLLGVGLAVAIMVLRREGQNLFAQTDYGYDIIVGPPKGSPLQLTLNTVYQIDVSPGVIPYSIYTDMSRKTPPEPGQMDFRPYVRVAVPYMVGDSYSSRRIVGTSPVMFGVDDQGKPITGPKFQYRRAKSYELAQGRVFAPRKFEAIVGSDVASKLHLHLYNDNHSEAENEKTGGAFRATHGMPAANQKPDIHKPVWHIVGILKPTHTAMDRVLFVPIVSLYAIAEHEGGMIDQKLLKANIDPSQVPPEKIKQVLTQLGIDPNHVPESVKRKFKLAFPNPSPATNPAASQAATGDVDPYHLDADGNIVPDLPQSEWEISAILVQSRGGFQAQRLMYHFKVVDPRATAINPASVMRQFFDTFLSGSTKILLLISALVTIVAAASIMTTIYNSVSARLREIAILRALGATRARILTIICTEAVVVGLIGGIIGLIAGHALSALGSVYLQRTLGEGINWTRVGVGEWWYLLAVVVLAFLAGLVPAMKAYRTPVATNLVAV